MIEKTIDISALKEICNQLGIPEKSIINFIESSYDESKKQKIDEEKTAIFLIEKYQEHLNKLVNINKRSITTQKSYNNFLSRLSSFLSNNYPTLKISELNEVIVNNFITNNKRNKKYSVGTINAYNTIVKSILKFAYNMDYTNKNYSYKFTLEKTSLIPRYIREESIPIILETLQHFSKPHRCRAMIMFLLYTGCRVSEISQLKLKDFDIHNDLIYIYDGKGNKDRVIPMFKELKHEILTYLRKSGMLDWNQKCDGYLFSRDENMERKRWFPERTIQHLVERIRICLPELPHITAHSFRHTFAVYCLKNKINETYLTQVLGHSDPKTTMTYTTLSGEDLREEFITKFPFRFDKLLNTINEGKNENNS